MRTAVAIALVTVAAGCGGATATPVETTAPPARFAGAKLDPPRTSPPLALTDQHGRRLTLAGQRGRYALVTFVYTHCPDVCPLITSSLNTALRILGPDANVSVLAVSVDPRGDTPAAIRAYARRMHLDPRFHYLRGTPAELRRTWGAWNVAAVSRDPELVDHVAYTALVDPHGKQRVLYDARVRAQQVVHDLRILLRKRNGA